MNDKLTRAMERHQLAKLRYQGAVLIGPTAMQALWWANAWWTLANKLRKEAQCRSKTN